MVNLKLAAFLQDAAGRDFVRLHFDCCYWLADWVVAATGQQDPASDLRGLEMDYGQLGYVRLVQRLAERAGLERTETPQPGDIGLLRNRPGTDVVGGIRTLKGWAVLSQGRGLSIAIPELSPRLRLMAAWRVPIG